MDLSIFGVLGLLFALGAFMTYVARETYQKPARTRTIIMLVLWFTTTFVGVAIYGVAVKYFQRKSASVPGPVEPVLLQAS